MRNKKTAAPPPGTDFPPTDSARISLGIRAFLRRGRGKRLPDDGGETGGRLRRQRAFILGAMALAVGFRLLWIVLTAVLQRHGLQVRLWVSVVAFWVQALLLGAVLFGIFWLLKRWGVSTLETIWWRKLVATAGMLLTLFLAGISLLYGTVLFAYFAKPEHVVEREGQKLVAVVTSFLDTSVHYYPYQNFFVYGSEVVGQEWYGSGSFDPFTRDPVPAPKSATFP